jgi:hypothetical protein
MLLVGMSSAEAPEPGLRTEAKGETRMVRDRAARLSTTTMAQRAAGRGWIDVANFGAQGNGTDETAA